MSRKPIIAGNWKMNLGIAEGLTLATEVRNRVSRVRNVEVVLGPNYASLHAIAQRVGESHIRVAAQNCHAAPSGAFTGELSVAMLKEAGCTYVIVGHSERRALFGETNEGVGEKARSIIDGGLLPIVCVGESLAEREAGRTLDVVFGQLDAGLGQLEASEIPDTVVAYEPVWAIGTGKTATPAQAQEVHAALRKRIAESFGAEAAARIRLQYGGSVKPANIRELMAQEDIDGALVGGASLKAESFTQIITFGEESDR